MKHTGLGELHPQKGGKVKQILVCV